MTAIPVHPFKLRSGFACDTEDSADDAPWQLPKIFLTYLRFGAKVCSPPAIDREFKTTDFSWFSISPRWTTKSAVC